MARMRTITQTMEYLREKDPNSAISEWWLRQMLKSGKLKHHKAGNKYLINLDCLEEYLRNPPEDEDNPDSQYGVLRQVK